jgi:hypothetical protein
MTDVPTAQDGAVLAGVKATPCGWPPASLDPGSGRHELAAIGTPAQNARPRSNPTKRSLYGFRGLPDLAALVEGCLHSVLSATA